jgi:hypothetical protein
MSRLPTTLAVFWDWDFRGYQLYLGSSLPVSQPASLIVTASIIHCGAATPFFATMAQRGQLEYPLFGLSLGDNSSGSLTFGTQLDYR